MTSANVIEYYISNDKGEIVAKHRQNIMCKRDTRKLLELLNPETLWMRPWGYDEEEELWEGKPQRLDKWLKKNTNEIFEDIKF